MRLTYTTAASHLLPTFAHVAVATAGSTWIFLACALCAGCGVGRALHLERQMAWVTSHPNAPSPVKQAVLGKKLQEGVGMTTGAVVASWGEPREKLDLGGGDARWIYRRPQARNTGRVIMVYTLIFNRGYLTKVLQTERR